MVASGYFVNKSPLAHAGNGADACRMRFKLLPIEHLTFVFNSEIIGVLVAHCFRQVGERLDAYVWASQFFDMGGKGY